MDVSLPCTHLNYYRYPDEKRGFLKSIVAGWVFKKAQKQTKGLVCFAAHIDGGEGSKKKKKIHHIRPSHKKQTRGGEEKNNYLFTSF